ncbi:NUDIX domain-containing protein [Maribacter sp. IgM3_T14_3]|uniref:NUDIX domain-containing protein n=1 Tax=Maribacter sp. IgM3_T14_3 TaxID=3415140 RepID=UPI003C6EC869
MLHTRRKREREREREREGGKREKGESDEQTLVREVSEELTVNIILVLLNMLEHLWRSLMVPKKV